MPVVFVVSRILRIPGHMRLIPLFHAGLCRILGIETVVSGELCAARPTLYVSNHSSYLDVFVLGFLPAYFIAKSEVAGWPVLGRLAKLQHTLFVERRAGKAKHQLHTMQAHLAEGNSLTLFAEGTSTDGAHVEPFKSSLFAAANLGESERRVAIQPITVAYTHYNGERIVEQRVRDHYAWYARMPFAPHFMGLMPLKKVGAKIHLHPVCYLDEFETRKLCADHCQQQVADKLDELIQTD
ncbi:lysophospholipid acyltransferase family protein [Arenicella chitinivorans]|nr:lysophospholipid acyltransferase family protein [Arenicella chitinivorans]